MTKSILVVDDDLSFLSMLEVFFGKNGFHTHCFGQAPRALQFLKEQKVDLVLTDYRMPDMDGMQFMEKALALQPELPLVMMTSYAEVQLAVKAMQKGARNYLAKPINPHELLKLVGHLLQEGPRPVVAAPKTQAKTPERSFGPDPFWTQFLPPLERVAQSDYAVLIAGESGSGKEFLAHYLHQRSPRSKGPFIAVDCGSFNEELLASELFGHRKGAFTGAQEDKEGFLAAADGGSLFLDEIGNLSLKAQQLLLRSLQERRFRPLGAAQERSSNFRLIAATNAPLKADIEAGRFRLDLYHRLSEVDLHLVPLRERLLDIPYYAQQFGRELAAELGLNFSHFSPELEASLLAYPWPGNLRELRNALKKSFLFAKDPNQLRPEDLPSEIRQGSDAVWAATGLQESHERALIKNSLAQAKNNKSQAARLLGIDRKTLYNKIKHYGLEA